ncbi:MAG: hypothetical protein OXD44_10480, partial [Gammaproteobacteria bacterium]|nr:hypothetical protein [Gammaproteobacteria bacterium]
RPGVARDAPLAGKRQLGCSQDKRPDCAQVVIAPIVMPDGFPVACEVLPGNASDKTALLDFMRRIEAQHGRSERAWVMDRGIPTEETLAAMRAHPSGVRYLAGTPQGTARQAGAILSQPALAVGSGFAPGQAASARGRRGSVPPGAP